MINCFHAGFPRYVTVLGGNLEIRGGDMGSLVSSSTWDYSTSHMLVESANVTYLSLNFLPLCPFSVRNEIYGFFSLNFATCHVLIRISRFRIVDTLFAGYIHSVSQELILGGVVFINSTVNLSNVNLTYVKLTAPSR